MPELTFETQRQTQLLDITAAVRTAVAGASAAAVNLFVPHTTAGVLLQASGERATKVASDVETALERLITETGEWQHINEGDKNPWAHVRAVLTASSLTIPLRDGDLALGGFQSVFLAEFDGPRTRKVTLTLL